MSVIVKGGGGVSVKFDDNYKGTLYIKPDKSTPKNIVSFEASADLPTEVWSKTHAGTAGVARHILALSSGEFYSTEGDLTVRKYNSDGEIIASYTVETSNLTNVFSFIDGNIMITDSNYHYCVIDSDLTSEISRTFIAINTSTVSPKISLDGILYLTSKNKIHKFDEAGHSELSLTGVSQSTACMADRLGNLYIPLSGKLTKLTPDLTEIWKIADTIVARSMMFDSEENLIVGCQSGTIYKISQEGEIIWSCSDASVTGAYSLEMDKDGNFIVGFANGYINKITPYGALCYSMLFSSTPNLPYLGVDQNGNIYASSMDGATKKLSDAGIITHKAVFNY